MAEKKSLSSSDARELRKLVDHDHPELTVSRQCELLGLPRSTLYYKPVQVSESSLRIMARIDSLYLEDPTAGSRRMVQYLARDDIPISRDRVRNLMRRMGLRAIYQRPRTTVPGSPSERFPCLVDLQQLTAPDQVWATDITYIPLRRAFCTWWPLPICSHGMCSAGNSPTALTRSFAWRRWRWAMAASHRSFTRIRAVNSPHRPLFNDSRQKTSRSAGQEGGDALTTSWWKGGGEPSSMRRCICVPTAMAGKRKSVWPASCGGIAM